MAYNIIRPRHGIKSLWDQYKSRIYKTGEMLVESPESGVGSGQVNIKFGDGVTNYENLPYAVQAPTDELVEGSKAPMTAGAGFELNKKIASAVQQDAIDKAKKEATDYTDTKISQLINGAPATLDTLKEVADAMAQNENVVEALEQAIGSKAPASHGNHVPATQSASNSVFLRNDNTWQTVTPQGIGAAPTSHTQGANTISAGTFAGKVNANPTAASGMEAYQMRDIAILNKSDEPTAGASAGSLPKGLIVFIRK